jgi:hypothetical protein
MIMMKYKEAMYRWEGSNFDISSDWRSPEMFVNSLMRKQYHNLKDIFSNIRRLHERLCNQCN